MSSTKKRGKAIEQTSRYGEQSFPDDEKGHCKVILNNWIKEIDLGGYLFDVIAMKTSQMRKLEESSEKLII